MYNNPVRDIYEAYNSSFYYNSEKECTMNTFIKLCKKINKCMSCNKEVQLECCIKQKAKCSDGYDHKGEFRRNEGEVMRNGKTRRYNIVPRLDSVGIFLKRRQAGIHIGHGGGSIDFPVAQPSNNDVY